MLSLLLRSGPHDLLSPLWIVFVYAIQVIGELYIIPIGFSAVSKWSPKKYSTFTMGLWLVSISCGHYIASLLARFSALPESSTLSQSMDEYRIFFLYISFIPFAAALCLLGGFFVKKYFYKLAG